MTWLSDLVKVGRGFTMLTERLDRLRAETDRLAQTSSNHAERLVRIETLIEMARAQPRRIRAENTDKG